MRRAAPIAPLALTLLLAACGQKGPLYLPGDEAAAERYGPQDTQDDTRTADEDDD
ncbi:lipoprotein [Halomonas beimenensis]|uniref:Lipoprotein n=1 Tax=Halomonas beimenensis TaxID=475662 RepID=A0A291P2M8_9GAMM|nr:lipoprotein [Halomonas beimenensis]ATJ81132.1 hypothetical protein BEI_0145 [Halomonas beimenensis]